MNNDKWLSSGRAFLGDGIFWNGMNLHKDLIPKMNNSVFRMFVYAVVDRELPEWALQILEYMGLNASFPDVGIWPNLSTALASNHGATQAVSMLSGLGMCQSSYYGRIPEYRSSTFFNKLNQEVLLGNQDLELFIDNYIKQNKIIYGYGRPLEGVKLDERVYYMLEFLEKINKVNSPIIQTCLKVHKILNKRKNLTMNISSLCAAIGVEVGLTPREYTNILFYSLLNGQMFCSRESDEAERGSLFPLTCDQVLSLNNNPTKRW